MEIKNKKRSDSLFIKRKYEGNNGVVDAVLINRIEFSLSLKLHNLFNFFIDCINKLQTNKQTESKNLLICIEHIKKITIEKKGYFDKELENLFQEFLEEAANLSKIVKEIVNSDKKNSGYLTDTLLSAKTSRLQWLAVCILTELQMTFSRI